MRENGCPLAWTFTHRLLEKTRDWPIEARTYAAISSELVAFLTACGWDAETRIAKMDELSPDLVATITERPDHTLVVTFDRGAVRLDITADPARVAKLTAPETPGSVCGYRPAHVRDWIVSQEAFHAARH